MTEDEHLAAFGLRPRAGDVPRIRSLLAAETARERAAQGRGDTALMKVCCVQLFNSGALADALLIWRAKPKSTDPSGQKSSNPLHRWISAKTASFDADCSIDIQLLCGSGVPQTRA